MTVEDTPGDDDFSEELGLHDPPETDRDEDEQVAADELEVDQKELEELGLVLDDPHQPEDE